MRQFLRLALRALYKRLESERVVCTAPIPATLGDSAFR